jgi:splicing factor 3A subunit 1
MADGILGAGPGAVVADADMAEVAADSAVADEVVAEGDAPATKSIGLIQPPPDMKSIVDKTAAFVAKNGPQFEQRIMNNERNTTKFAFLQTASPYFPYYQKRLVDERVKLQLPGGGPAPGMGSIPTPVLAEVLAAEGGDAKKEGAGAIIESKADVSTKKPSRPLKAPEADVFTVKPPEGLSIPSLDLDVIKLTAQYVALNGRSFLNGNPPLQRDIYREKERQIDRPHH